MKRGWAGIALSALVLLVGSASAQAQAPSNDHWPGTPISVPAHETLAIGDAMTDATDPVIPCAFGGRSQAIHSVWFSYTTGSSPVYVSLATTGSQFIDHLAVFTGRPGAFDLVPGGCVSDSGGDAQLNGLRLAPNTTYSIELATWRGEPQLLHDEAVLDMSSSPVYTVTTTADLAGATCNADCSLREAISAANAAPGAVLIPKGIYKLSGAAVDDANHSGDLDVLAGYNIYGAGPGETVIDAQGNDRVLDAPEAGRPDRELGVNGLTLRDGTAGEQGGNVRFEDQGGDVRLDQYFSFVDLVDMDLEHGHSRGQGGAVFAQIWSGRMLRVAVSGSDADAGGGLMDNSEEFEVRDSTFTGNSAISGGGIASTGHDVAIINSTVSGNTGAGVLATTEIDLRSSTVTGNSGGGLYFDGDLFAGYKARVANSVLAGNAGSDCVQASAPLSVLKVTYSHVDTASGGCDLAGTGNVIGAGATVIDRGDPVGCTDQDGLALRTDQNALPRIANGDSVRGAICDQGATEVQDKAAVCGPSYIVTDGDTEAPFSLRCSDPEGAPLDYDVVGAAHGTVVGRTYYPPTGYSGPDTITYTVRDDANTVTATINVTVIPPPAQTIAPTPTPTSTPTPTPVATPVLSARPRPKPPVVSGLAAAKHGKSLSFKLSAPAKVTIKLVRDKEKKTITLAKGKTGRNTVTLKLKRGRYRVTVTVAGAATASKTLTLG